MSVRLPDCIRPCASGGAVLVDGSALPQWFPDWRAALAEAAARNLISPAGLTPEVRIPHIQGRSGPVLPVASVPGAAVPQHGGGVAGVGFPRTPATHQTSDRSAA